MRRWSSPRTRVPRLLCELHYGRLLPDDGDLAQVPREQLAGGGDHASVVTLARRTSAGKGSSLAAGGGRTQLGLDATSGSTIFCLFLRAAENMLCLKMSGDMSRTVVEGATIASTKAGSMYLSISICAVSSLPC